jgi:hypothetical protein
MFSKDLLDVKVWMFEGLGVGRKVSMISLDEIINGDTRN